MIHEQIHQHKTTSPQIDPVLATAEFLINQYNLIVLDEFQILDISDAMILLRIFEKIFNSKSIMVFTSNREPSDLYHDSFGREHVSKLISLIRNHHTILSLDGEQDYRLQKTLSAQELFYTPNDSENNQKIDTIIENLTEKKTLKAASLKVFDRNINFQKTLNQLLITDFDELCRQHFSQNDYIEICKHFKIIIVKNVPKLSTEMHNEAKRFLMFIDQAYIHQVILILSLECAINLLYTEGKGAFEFARTISRLYEMQTRNYINHKL